MSFAHLWANTNTFNIRKNIGSFKGDNSIVSAFFWYYCYIGLLASIHSFSFYVIHSVSLVVYVIFKCDVHVSLQLSIILVYLKTCKRPRTNNHSKRSNNMHTHTPNQSLKRFMTSIKVVKSNFMALYWQNRFHSSFTILLPSFFLFLVLSMLLFLVLFLAIFLAIHFIIEHTTGWQIELKVNVHKKKFN